MERFNNRIKVTPVEDKSDVSTQYTGQMFEVFWQNLSYKLTKISIPIKKKIILNGLNGYFRSGEVTAIMGPSGAGKSTLLEIICGRRSSRVSSAIRLRGVDEVKIGFVPQDNCLMEFLTVKETFVFTSKLLNTEEPALYHKLIAKKFITRFGLQPCADTYSHRCSGGQQKRLLIALEVLSQPNILVLDEPTTGLDSPTCAHIVDILHKLVANSINPMAILMTIHQPSVSVYNNLQRIYVLTSNGRCLYQGSPISLVPSLDKLDLVCDPFTSPADYIIEIAAGDFGPEPIDKLCLETEVLWDLNQITTANTKTLSKSLKRFSHPFGRHFKILFIRSQLRLYRDPLLTVLRVITTLVIAVVLSLLYGSDIGKVSGCVPRKLEIYYNSPKTMFTKFDKDVRAFLENNSFLFIGVMINFFGGVGPALLNYPREMLVFHKEYHNGWYSCLSYYLSRSFSDIPIQIINSVLYLSISYNMTSQPAEPMRFLLMLAIMLLMSFSAQIIGEIVSAIWMESPMKAVLMGAFIPLLMILVGGFLVRVARMPSYMRPFAWFSLLRYSLEAMIISIYGFGRCDYVYQQFLSTVNVSTIHKPMWFQSVQLLIKMTNPDEDLYDDVTQEDTEEDLKRFYSKIIGKSITNGQPIDFNQSVILQYLELNDYYLFKAFAIIIVYMFALKISTYFVLLAKLHSKK